MSVQAGQLIVDLIARTAAFVGPMRAAGSEIRALSTAVESMTGRIGSAVAQIGGMVGALGGLASVGWGVKLAADTEQAEIGFTTLLGSAQDAKKMMADLEQFAAHTPFQFPELAASAKKMLALGFAADEVMPTLQALGDATSGLGGNAELLDRITVALGQMRAKGVVSAEEMRQLAEAGIPAWKILAETIGVSIPEAMEMVKDRAVESSAAVPALLQGIAEKFGGGMEAQSKSLTGLFSTLKDSVGFLFRDMGNEISDALNLKEGISSLSAALERMRGDIAATIGAAVEMAAEWGPSLARVVIVLGSVRAALWTMQAASRAVAATQALIVAMSGPQGWAAIAIGIGVAAAAMYALDESIESVREAAEKANEKIVAVDPGPVTKMADEAKRAADELEKLGRATSGIGAGMSPLLATGGAGSGTLDAMEAQHQALVREMTEMQAEVTPHGTPAGERVRAELWSVIDASQQLTGQLEQQAQQLEALTAAPGHFGEVAGQAGAALMEQVRIQQIAEQQYREVIAGWNNGTLSAAEAERRTIEIAAGASAELHEQQAQYEALIGPIRDAVDALGGVEAAMKKAKKAAEDGTTPLESYQKEQRELDQLLKAGLLTAEQHAQAMKKATDDFDKALGGPAGKIKDLKEKIATFGQSANEQMIEQFRSVAGVTAEQIAEMEQLAKKLDKLELRKKLFDEGKQIADSLRTPIEQMHDEADHLQRLLAEGAISENTFAAAMVKKQEELFGKFGDNLAPGLERGSRAAVVAVQQAAAEREGSKERDRAIQLQKDQLEEQRKARENLDNIRDNIRPTDVVGIA